LKNFQKFFEISFKISKGFHFLSSTIHRSVAKRAPHRIFQGLASSRFDWFCHQSDT